MGDMMKTVAYVSFIVLCTLWAVTGLARGNPDNIHISYKAPKDPELLVIHERLKEGKTLERLKDFLKPYRLPRKLRIVLTDCDGESDAFYGNRKITVCYEYINELWKRMPAQTTPSGVAPIDTVIGPLVDTSLHEFAHALFEMLEIPILGQEEDAADQVGAYIYLQLGVKEARRLITGTAFAYLYEAERAKTNQISVDYSDEHGTPEQRAYNVLCIAYGADPKIFSDFVAEDRLPETRAVFCEEEHEQIQDAYDTLIGPYIDQDLANEVFERSWLQR